MSAAFVHPAGLAAGLAAALAILALALRAHQRPGIGVQVVGQRPLPQGLGLALVALGLGLGLAQPRWGAQPRPGLTVRVVLDASRSMAVPDAGGGRTRWDAAVAALDRLWSRPVPGVQWSLDLLTGDVVPLQPPGEDRTLLRESLRALAPGALGSPGSSLGRGLVQVAAGTDRATPAVVLYLGDGEETWERPGDALDRARSALQATALPFCALAFGDGRPHPVPGVPGPGEPPASAAQAAWLEALAQATGGRRFPDPEAAAAGLQALAEGRAPLPAGRSLQPTHPEAGAWLALAGLALWLAFAGKPLAKWRPVLGLLLALAAPGLSAQGAWAPESLRAWATQRALVRGDLEAARRWRPTGELPDHRLLAAAVDLRTGEPEAALRTLAPLVDSAVARPLPSWRVPALLLAARAHRDAQRSGEARRLLERLLLEAPGHPEAVHDLQTLVRDAPPPPPPGPRTPPPPPRPALGAQQDELEGLRQRLPRPKAAPGGVRDY